jgi:putative membrane protein
MNSKIGFFYLKTKMIKKDLKIREHLANERTFLAWVRTGIGIMAFGFVVEKFSLFMKEIANFLGKPNLTSNKFFPGISSVLGIILVVFGVLTCLLAFLKYLKILKQINSDVYKASVNLNILLIVFVILIGILLAIYLSIGL